MKAVIGLGKTGTSIIGFLRKNGEKNILAFDTRENFDLQNLPARYPEVSFFCGKIYFTKDFFKDVDLAIISPGVPLKILDGVLDRTKIISDVELFARFVPRDKAKIVAITGSNGKSSVSAMVYHMAKEVGLKAKIGANFGEPALNLLDDETQVYVLELSSFQLETTYSLRPDVATLLNISPDHLDRYDSLADYEKAKMRVFNQAKNAVINLDEEYSQNFSQPALTFALEPKADFYYDGKYLCFRQEKIMEASALKVKGLCQIANVLAALALGYSLDFPFSKMVVALQNFAGLPHRTEFVAKLDDAFWYNDSKGTNVGATKAAILNFAEENNKIILILGGMGKNQDFSYLNEVVNEKVYYLILIGRDAQIISNSIANIPRDFSKNLLDAVQKSRAILKDLANDSHKKIVLFSPACASFDMFKNFEARGEAFKEMVLAQKI